MVLPIFFQPTPQSINAELIWLDPVSNPTRAIVSYGGSDSEGRSSNLWATRPVGLDLAVGDTVSMSWVGLAGGPQTLRIDGIVSHAPPDAPIQS